MLASVGPTLARPMPGQVPLHLLSYWQMSYTLPCFLLDTNFHFSMRDHVIMFPIPIESEIAVTPVH